MNFDLLQPYCEGRDLTAEQRQQLSVYLELLLKWNARTNLTALRRPEEIVTRHFGESLFAGTRLLAPEKEIMVFDFGSGAGFPGLPMKILEPAIALTLIESQNKKATFLREVVRALDLKKVEVFAGRAEVLNRKADLVSMRAVEKFEATLPVAASLVGVGGSLALLIGESQINRAEEVTPSFTWAEPMFIPGSQARVLLNGIAHGTA